MSKLKNKHEIKALKRRVRELERILAERPPALRAEPWITTPPYTPPTITPYVPTQPWITYTDTQTTISCDPTDQRFTINTGAPS